MHVKNMGSVVHVLPYNAVQCLDWHIWQWQNWSMYTQHIFSEPL